jgi:FixJ family two-component response regulator
LDKCGVPSLFVSGQIGEARKNKDAALGFLGKPWRSRTLLASVDVAHRLINGENPDPVPSELELFQDREK